MKRLLLSVCFFAATSLVAQQTQTFDIKADDWSEGEPPKDVFVVAGVVKIAPRDGNKAIVIDPGTELVDASAQLAVSAAGNASIEAKILATKRGRSSPRFGVSVHGMSGHRLIVNPAKKALELVRNDQTLATVPFSWTSAAWVKVKLEAKKDATGDTWLITGKAWPADAAEPAEPLIKHADKNLKGQGKCALWATPFSGEPVFFDDIHIAVRTASE